MSNPLSYLHDQLEQWRQEGTYQRLRVLESESAAESRFDGKQVINLASNNYLGLTTHPKLREAAIALGAPRWKVIVLICYRAALDGIATGNQHFSARENSCRVSAARCVHVGGRRERSAGSNGGVE